MEKALKDRTIQFAWRIMHLVDALPETTSATAIGRQIIRSRTSAGANDRAACRGRSKAECISKLGIVAKEADETCFWLELILEGNLLPEANVQALLQEADALTAIFVSSIKTSQQNQQSKIGVQKS